MRNQVKSLAPTQNEQRITSLELADFTGKPHSDLMKSIRKMEEVWIRVNEGNFSSVNERKFALVEYVDAKGERRPMYSLSKMESLYIAAKFSDEVRARLVLRWYELETQNLSKGKAFRLRMRPQEQQLLHNVATSLVKGDIRRVAEELKLTPKHVSAVKCGYYRSTPVMKALVAVALHNMHHNICDGYSGEWAQTALFTSNLLA